MSAAVARAPRSVRLRLLDAPQVTTRGRGAGPPILLAAHGREEACSRGGHGLAGSLLDEGSIPRLDRVEQGLVRAQSDAECTLARVDGRGVALAPIHELADREDQAVAPGGCVRAHVEASIKVVERREGVGVLGSCHPRDCILQVGRVGWSQTLREMARREPLEGDPYRMGLLDVVDQERSGHRSAPWLRHDETLHLEQPKRSADRNDADPELRRERREPEWCAGRQLTGDEDVELSHRMSATGGGHLEPHLWLTTVSWRRRPEMSNAATNAEGRLMAESHDPHVRLSGPHHAIAFGPCISRGD